MFGASIPHDYKALPDLLVAKYELPFRLSKMEWKELEETGTFEKWLMDGTQHMVSYSSGSAYIGRTEDCKLFVSFTSLLFTSNPVF